MTDDVRRLGDRYVLEERLGTGAVADVWRARDERLGRHVAVKVFRGEAADELGNAQDEVRMLARLDHPGLATIYDTGSEPDGTSWVVMRLVEGHTLADELRLGPLHPETAARYGAELASALAYVHSHGVVHRDVKPGNVLIGTDGRVALADFGIARIVDSPRRTMTGQVVGTPAYFAPEQVSGARIGPEADVYSLGLLLLECLTGRREFTGSALEVAMARVHRDPDVPAGLPPTWFSLIVAMTARQPVERPKAAQVEQTLRRYLAGEQPTLRVAPPTAATQAMRRTQETTIMPPTAVAAMEQPATAAEPVRPRSRIHPGVILVVLLILAGIGIGVGYAATHHQASIPEYVPAGSPSLPQPLEGDMQRLEDAVR